MPQRAATLVEDADRPSPAPAAPPELPGAGAVGLRPVRGREVAALVLLVALADATIYRGHGFAGYAALFLAAPALLWLGHPRPRRRAGFWIVGAMLILLALRTVWLGSGLGVGAGFALLAAFALALAGRPPYVLDVIACAAQVVVAGFQGLSHYERSARQRSLRAPRVAWLSVLLPLAALALFGTLFVLANPDLAEAVVDAARRFFRSLGDWLADLLPDWQEALFWLIAAWVAVGLLRPILRRSVLARFSRPRPPATGTEPVESPLYPALRNTLAAVIGLFAVYLVFEFKTLWFRDFPKGFYYAGYAHEGAAWLTAALALATVVLSLVFRGRVLGDPRLPRLRRLAWVWSAENLVLAVAVFHRLFIYIGFNGMTRMRMVGLFGCSAVAVGFVLVVWKIAYGRDFVWLVRRHLWTVALAAYLFALTPVDAIAHRYNVRRVLAGDLPPAVQISVHPISAEGILVLPALVESQNEIIREGIRAMLAERALAAEAAARREAEQGWTTFQLAQRRLRDRLDAVQTHWQEYRDPAKRSAALARFHEYVYQWY